MTSFAALVHQFLDEEYAASPVLASSLGLIRYDHQLDNLTESSFEGRRMRTQEWLGRFGEVADEGLSFDDQIDRDLLLSALRGRAVMDDWQMWRRQPATYLDPGLQGVFGLLLHRLRPEPELAEAVVHRFRAVPWNILEGKRNLRPEMVPAIYLERAIGQARAGARYARELVASELGRAELRPAVADAGAVAADAFDDFAAFLEGMRGEARGEWAIGEERYSGLLLEKEMLGFDARQLRERGEAEYDRTAEELRKCAQELKGTDDWASVLAELNRDHPATPEEMRKAYEEWTARARAFLAEQDLVTFPEGEHCEVIPSPHFRRPIMAVAAYSQPPAFAGSRTGYFFVPFPPDGVSEAEVQQRLESNNHSTIPTVAVHEAYPGHHWHLVATLENERAVRHVFRTAYFSEGWGLYAERMMREEGFYSDVRHIMSQHEATLFRAARIIVDTSLHMGEMGFEEGVRFMMEKANLPEPTARAEVGRYCSWPTQASSYLTGCLEIVRIRERFMREKGLSGDAGLKRFHDKLARTGCLPIALAERAVMEG